MKLEVRVGDRAHAVEAVSETANGLPAKRLRIRIDDREVDADAATVATDTYSILIGGQAFEARVQPEGDVLRIFVAGEEYTAQVIDPRAWRSRRGSAMELEGRQQIAAPMPGKIVRVLVAQGAPVEAGQGLLVVEAMKMQNEIRSPKAGVVERLLVVEGQAVNAGDILIVVA